MWLYFLNNVMKLPMLSIPFWVVESFLISSQILRKDSEDSIWFMDKYQYVSLGSHLLDVMVWNLVFGIEADQHAGSYAVIAIDGVVAIHQFGNSETVFHLES